MTEVFVSYASKDRAKALPIINAISRAGLKTWPDEALSPESPIASRLQGAIESAQCLVVLWSKAAAESEFPRKEMHHAIKAWSSDRLVLASLDDTPMPVGLRDLSAIPIRSPNDSGTKELIERARAIVGRDKTRLAAKGIVPSAPQGVRWTRQDEARILHPLRAVCVFPRFGSQLH
jgi:hypothetical protein